MKPIIRVLLLMTLCSTIAHSFKLARSEFEAVRDNAAEEVEENHMLVKRSEKGKDSSDSTSEESNENKSKSTPAGEEHGAVTHSVSETHPTTLRVSTPRYDHLNPFLTTTVGHEVFTSNAHDDDLTTQHGLQ